jgi:hypothetical protein
MQFALLGMESPACVKFNPMQLLLTTMFTLYLFTLVQREVIVWEVGMNVGFFFPYTVVQ